MSDGSTSIERLAEAISAHAAAVRELTATLRAVRTAEPTSLQTGVRAGAARGSEPIGTPVALREDKKDKDRSIDRSNLLDLSFGKEEVRPCEVRQRAGQLFKMLSAKKKAAGILAGQADSYQEENPQLVVAAVVIARRFGAAGSEWLADAERATERKWPCEKPFGYFRRCLANGLHNLPGVVLPLQAPGERNCAAEVFNRLVKRVPALDVLEEWRGEQRVSEAG